MLETVHLQTSELRVTPGPQCTRNAFRIVPPKGLLSAYAIARLVLATGCCIDEVVENVAVGAWTCPQFGVLCSHVAALAAA